MMMMTFCPPASSLPRGRMSSSSSPPAPPPRVSPPPSPAPATLTRSGRRLPAPLSLISRKPEQTKARKKYARSKPPSPPCVAPYPVDKKKKSELDLAEEELEALTDRNGQLQEKLAQMETEFKYLKKLMVEAGLGKYTQAVNY